MWNDGLKPLARGFTWIMRLNLYTTLTWLLIILRIINSSGFDFEYRNDYLILSLKDNLNPFELGMLYEYCDLKNKCIFLLNDVQYGWQLLILIGKKVRSLGFLCSFSPRGN